MRVRQVWGSDLPMRLKVQAHNTWAVASLIYPLEAWLWTKSDVLQLDRSTRVTVERLYIPKN